MWARLSDLPIRRRLWHKQWDVISEIRLQKNCGFYFGHILSLSLFLPLYPSISLSELSLQKKPAAWLKSPPHGEAHVIWDGCLWLAASKDLGSSVQQPWRNWIRPTVTRVKFGSEPSPHWAPARPQLWPRAWLKTVETLNQKPWLPDSQKPWDNNSCWSCYVFRMTCYVVTDALHSWLQTLCLTQMPHMRHRISEQVENLGDHPPNSFNAQMCNIQTQAQRREWLAQTVQQNQSDWSWIQRTPRALFATGSCLSWEISLCTNSIMREWSP